MDFLSGKASYGIHCEQYASSATLWDFFSVHNFMIYCWPAICEKLIMDMEQDNKELERGNVQDLIWRLQ